MTIPSAIFCTVHEQWYGNVCQLCEDEATVITPDEALEALIEHATDLVVRVGDQRLVDAQRALISLRSPERVAHMEQERGLG